jgi:hypothetical protein
MSISLSPKMDLDLTFLNINSECGVTNVFFSENQSTTIRSGVRARLFHPQLVTQTDPEIVSAALLPLWCSRTLGFGKNSFLSIRIKIGNLVLEAKGNAVYILIDGVNAITEISI